VLGDYHSNVRALNLSALRTLGTLFTASTLECPSQAAP
jgi:hypothetical protein